MALNTANQQVWNSVSDIQEKIARMVDEIQFGSIEIIIHDGRIVQIERREKLRFDGQPREKGC